MKKLIAVLFFICLSVQAFPEDLKFRTLTDYDVKYFNSDFFLGTEEKLARWEKGHIWTKDPLNAWSTWKKGMAVDISAINVKISDKTGSRSVGSLLLKDACFSGDGGIGAFTLAFGESVVTTVAVMEMRSKKILYTADLWARVVKDRKHAPIPMKNIWMSPSISDDNGYVVCRGYTDRGTPESLVIRLSDGKIEKISGAAMARTAGEMIFFLRPDAKKNKTDVIARKLAGGADKKIGEVREGALGLEVMSGTGYVVTDTKIYAFNLQGGEFRELHDYSYLKEGNNKWEIEKMFSGTIRGSGYIFLAVKKIVKDKYTWKLLGMRVK